MFASAAQGRSIAEIAAAAHLSESTIKSHVSSILAKLGLASRLQLVAFAHRHGLG
ncbi:response regulator transcription factor [Rathayibacter tanaceti]|uniref:response regulator transcription factor n=1 Tax=Rathayibacter tanaceti TaxID=1671680 RepID=UPI001F00DC2D|nr:LuxR C-terminal-related transcriptional regulator [Rathayibacter tanaceti]